MRDDRFLIITGVSGSGKTVASRFLEDLGYYCMDNLPSKLIPNFVKLWSDKEVEIGKVALVLDVRESGFSTEFAKVLKSIREKIPCPPNKSNTKQRRNVLFLIFWLPD